MRYFFTTSLFIAVILFPLQSYSQNVLEQLFRAGRDALNQNLGKIRPTERFSRIQTWNYGFIDNFGSSGNQRACVAMGSYNRGSYIVIYRSEDGKSWIAISNPSWNFIQADSNYKAYYWFDDWLSWDKAIGYKMDIGYGLVKEITAELLERFAASRVLRFSYDVYDEQPRQLDAFHLHGSRNAVITVEACANSHFKADPFIKQKSVSNSSPEILRNDSVSNSSPESDALEKNINELEKMLLELKKKDREVSN